MSVVIKSKTKTHWEIYKDYGWCTLVYIDAYSILGYSRERKETTRLGVKAHYRSQTDEVVSEKEHNKRGSKIKANRMITHSPPGKKL